MMKKLQLLLFLVSFNFVAAFADITDDIATALRAGNAKQVAAFFNSNIELNIPGNEGVFSKAQAEVILRDFLSKNTPKNFAIMHQGASKDGAKYAIGNLEASTGSYRVYLFLKKQPDSSFVIKEFRIEADK